MASTKLKSLYTSDPTGTFEIVLSEDELTGKRSARLGKIAGHDPESDSSYVMRLGAKITPSQAKALYDHFQNEERK